MILDYKGVQSPVDLITKLTNEASRLETLAGVSKGNRERADVATQKIQSFKVNKAIGDKCAARLKVNIERVDRYLAKRKTEGIVNIKTGMLAARAIIPHGTTVKLEYDPPHNVYLLGEDNMLINETDGSGFRATISLFMRDRLLKSSGYLQTMVLDEPLSTLDLENSAEISKYIGAMAIESPVILIEQKPEVFVATAHTAYHFELIDGITHVRKEIVDGDSES